MTLLDLPALREAVEGVADPELSGVTIGQLGLILDLRVTGSHAEVDFSPTFLGCVAVGLILLDIENTVLTSEPLLNTCHVNIVHNVWSTDRISADGVNQLHALGIVVVRTMESMSDAPCPYCLRPGLEKRGGSGPTRCRSVAWCNGCRNVVEIMEPKIVTLRETSQYAHL